MDLQLKNKVIIVTGGAKGIGEAVTRELVGEGAIPVIVDRSAQVADAMVRQFETDGKKSLYINATLGDEHVSQQVIDQTISTFGKIDGIVNNAGVNDGIGLKNGSPGAFRKSVISNLAHYYDLVHLSIDHLIENKGSIVNISSKTAITGQGGTSAYAASKGAQLALTREWAVELAPYGVRVNAIVPSEVMTPQYEKWISTFDNPEEQLESIISKIPLGKRMTTSKEIASMTVFLLSSKSGHTTGQWQFIDGGYVHLDRSIL